MAELQENWKDDLKIEDEKKADLIKKSEVVRQSSIYLVHSSQETSLGLKGISDTSATVVNKDHLADSLVKNKKIVSGLETTQQQQESVKIEEYINKDGKQSKQDENVDVKQIEKLGDQIVNDGLIQFNEDEDNDEDNKFGVQQEQDDKIKNKKNEKKIDLSNQLEHQQISPEASVQMLSCCDYQIKSYDIIPKLSPKARAAAEEDIEEDNHSQHGQIINEGIKLVSVQAGRQQDIQSGKIQVESNSKGDIIQQQKEIIQGQHQDLNEIQIDMKEKLDIDMIEDIEDDDEEQGDRKVTQHDKAVIQEELNEKYDQTEKRGGPRVASQCVQKRKNQYRLEELLDSSKNEEKKDVIIFQSKQDMEEKRLQTNNQNEDKQQKNNSQASEGLNYQEINLFDQIVNNSNNNDLEASHSFDNKSFKQQTNNQNVQHQYKQKQEQNQLNLDINLIEEGNQFRGPKILHKQSKQQGQLQEQLKKDSVINKVTTNIEKKSEEVNITRASAQSVIQNGFKVFGENNNNLYQNNNSNSNSRKDSLASPRNGKVHTSDQTNPSNNLISFSNDRQAFNGIIYGNINNNSSCQEPLNNTINTTTIINQNNINNTLNATEIQANLNITNHAHISNNNTIIGNNLLTNQVSFNIGQSSQINTNNQRQESIISQQRDIQEYPSGGQNPIENNIGIDIAEQENDDDDEDANLDPIQFNPSELELEFAKNIFMQTIVTQVKILVLNSLVCLVMYWQPIREAIFMLISAIFILSFIFQVVLIIKKQKKRKKVTIIEKYDIYESLSFGFFFAVLFLLGKFNERQVVLLLSYTPLVHILMWRVSHTPQPKQAFMVNIRLCFRVMVFSQLLLISLRYDGLIQLPWLAVFVPALLVLVGLVFYLFQILILTIWHGLYSLCKSLPLAEFYGLFWGFFSFLGYSGCYFFILIGSIGYFEEESFHPLLIAFLECVGCNFLILAFDLLYRNKIKVYIAMSNRQKMREQQFDAEIEEMNRRVQQFGSLNPNNHHENNMIFSEINSELRQIQEQENQRHGLNSLAQSQHQRSMSGSNFPQQLKKKSTQQPVVFRANHMPFPLFMVQFSSTYFKQAESDSKGNTNKKAEGVKDNNIIINNNNNKEQSNKNKDNNTIQIPPLRSNNNENLTIFSNPNTERISEVEGNGALVSALQTQRGELLSSSRQLTLMQFKNNLNSEQLIQTLPNKKSTKAQNQVVVRLDETRVNSNNSNNNLHIMSISSPKADKLKQQKTFAMHKTTNNNNNQTTSTAANQLKQTEGMVTSPRDNLNHEHGQNPQSMKSLSVLSESDAQSNCLVCFEEPADVVLMPCGHGGICFSCASSICTKNRLCFLCRKTITTERKHLQNFIF